LCRVQPGLGPAHALRPAIRRTDRIDPDEPAAPGALGIRLPARARQRRGTPGRVPQATRLAARTVVPAKRRQYPEPEVKSPAGGGPAGLEGTETWGGVVFRSRDHSRGGRDQ